MWCNGYRREKCVIYWPSTEPSIKRCTCVNKQRNSGSRWTWDNGITKCHRRLGSVPVGVGVSWGTRCQRENQLADWGLAALSDPRLSNLSQDDEELLLWSEELWCSSLSTSPTHLSHITINPFENKVWEIYFCKEVCSLVHWSSSLLLIMFLHIFVYVYVCGYTINGSGEPCSNLDEAVCV